MSGGGGARGRSSSSLRSFSQAHPLPPPTEARGAVNNGYLRVANPPKRHRVRHVTLSFLRPQKTECRNDISVMLTRVACRGIVLLVVATEADMTEKQKWTKEAERRERMAASYLKRGWEKAAAEWEALAKLARTRAEEAK